MLSSNVLGTNGEGVGGGSERAPQKHIGPYFQVLNTSAYIHYTIKIHVHVHVVLTNFQMYQQNS